MIKLEITYELYNENERKYVDNLVTDIENKYKERCNIDYILNKVIVCITEVNNCRR